MDKCQTCGKPLAKLETIVAAGGFLFCSDDCGRCWYSENMRGIEDYFHEDLPDYEDAMEYVTPEEIGVC